MNSVAKVLPLLLVAYGMPCEEPFVPFARQSSGLARRERYPLAGALCAYGIDTSIDLCLPIPKQTPRLSRAFAGSSEELRLKALPVSLSIFLSHVLGEPLSRPAAFRTISEAADWVIDQFIGQLREARAEHNEAAAKMKAAFKAEIAELRGELLAQINATIAQIKATYAKEVATLQRQLAEARAELSKHQKLDASQSGNDRTRLN